ncbi:HAD hydrolase-like protein [Anaerolineales bacterium HSG25]|nr:HAD hydrolase-like protein [Anaerolineales bacterium HSG25]
MNNIYRPKLNIDALYFSLNDIVIDVRYSYQQVVRKAVQVYLEQTFALPPSKDSLITLEEVIHLQRVGGIANYWDLSRAFIAYFMSLLPDVPVVTFPIRFHVPAMLAYLQTAAARLHVDINELKAKKNIDQLTLDTVKAGGGLDGLYDALPDVNRHLVIASGNITQINLVGRIFQELYLGADLFERTYDQPAVLVQSTGYIEHESLLIDPELLALFGEKFPLGVLSSRPHLEVEHSLQARKVKDYFQVVISLEDIQKAKAKEIPDPWALLEAARRTQPTPTHIAYVSANPAGIRAARAANQTVPCTAVACLIGATDRAMIRQSFEDSKASVILGHPNNLKELIFD